MKQKEKHKIIYIEDDEFDRSTLMNFIDMSDSNFVCVVASSIKEGLEKMEKEEFDIALVDFKLGDGTAFDVIEKLSDIPFIILTGAGDEIIATEVMKKGAYDYVVKDITGNYLKTLPMIIKSSIKRKEAENELKRYQEDLEDMVRLRTEELKKEIEEHEKSAELALKQKMKLEEMFKQLNCIFAIFNKIIEPGITLDKFLLEVVELIPACLHFADQVNTRIVIDGNEYKSKGFKKAKSKLEANIMVKGRNIGIIEICVNDDIKEELGSDIFHGEEITFIEILTEKLGMLIENIRKRDQDSGSFKDCRITFAK